VKYQQDLQVQLRERYRRLVTTDYSGANHEVGLVVGWAERQSAIVALITEAEQVEPGLDFDEFVVAFKSQRGGVPWTSRTEAGRAVLSWRMMQRIVALTDSGGDGVRDLAFSMGAGTRLTDNWIAFVERVLQPFFDFIGERLGSGNNVLHSLERYVRRVEWFVRDELYDRYKEDTRNGEEVYNDDLQRFLFEDADIVTYAKVRSGSGEPDLVGELGTDDPLICDGKIFDGAGRSKAYIAKGFHQVIHYAHDYNKSAAYLVVFNMSDRLLDLPREDWCNTWPPFVESSGVRVYFIRVRAVKVGTASTAGKAKRTIISRNDLFDPDGD
jgi:hypothetical protein